jgi:signal transduction histidine kinase
MTTASFRFSTQLLARLGEELNPGPDQSILELVKNAFDADASTCTVELLDTSAPGGSVIVRDDGDGMDAKGLSDGWFVLGSSAKSKKTLTRRGRVPAGSKGLGRLAALRMGSRAALVTRPRSDPEAEYRVAIDWDAFDSVTVVEDVEFHITKRRAQERDAGTEARLENLQGSFGRSEVERLARAMLLLADPFEGKNAFQAVLKAQEFVDLERLVKDRYFQHAEYHLRASVDEEGVAKGKVVDWKGEVLFHAKDAEISSEGRATYSCPAAKFDLWVFLLSSQTFAGRSVPLGQVREWLKAFGGVHLYENGLRVTPYGNPGNDWLDMNLARSKSPEERPSTNTSLGRISIDNRTGVLNQKTDRSGYVENEAFLELRRFARDSLDWMARRRMAVAQTRRASQRSETRGEARAAKDDLEKALTGVPGKARSTVEAAVKRYDRARKREVKVLRREVELYRTLGTAGITAATFAHESSGSAVKVIGNAAKTIERRGRELLGNKYDGGLGEPVELIQRSTKTLAALGSVTLSLVDNEKRRTGRVNVHDTITKLLKGFDPFCLERRVDLDVQLAPRAQPFLRGTESAVEAIVANLVTNGLYWLEQSHGNQRVLRVRTKIQGPLLELGVLDSGPGLEGIDVDNIWLPGETTKPNGTGLGLAIVYDTVRDLGGSSAVTAHGELGGAEFLITLPLIRN